MARRRVLCLHGHRQCGEIFSDRLSSLQKRFSKEDNIDFYFVDGSIVLPLLEGQSVPMRGWWGPSGEGWEDSLKAIVTTAPSFDGVIGSSQLAVPDNLWSSLVIHPYFNIPSLHIIGEADELVPPTDSIALTTLFKDPVIYRHNLGHCVPQRAKDVDAIVAFIRSHLPLGAGVLPSARSIVAYDCNERQAEELGAEALQAIFGADISELSRRPPCCRLFVNTDGGTASLTVTMCPEYPEQLPAIDCDLGEIFGKKEREDLTLRARESLAAMAVSLLGSEMVFQLLETFREFIETERAAIASAALTAQIATGMHGTEDAIDLDQLPLIQDATAEAARCADGGRKVYRDPTSRGQWHYIIGLVGKPSAGKSTFFNAATDPLDPTLVARVAAFPFTTIDPNIGIGCISVKCPSSSLGFQSSPPLGFAANGNRRVAVTIKDVAGLVPGAYKGRGKGNAFLNDLCDAHVLIHVVDAASLTDSGGAAASDGEGSDPLADIAWIRHEVHMWIYNNVRAKWDSIVRRPTKLLEMFSGYHARHGHVLEALARMGIGTNQYAADLPSWTPKTLHRLVAHFLRVRFPVLLALNKADVPAASTNIARVLEQSGEPCVAVSAHSEWTLCQWRRQGLITYTNGAAAYDVEAKLAEHLKKEPDDNAMLPILDHVFKTWGGTGVLRALDEAVSLSPPLCVYPVENLDTCESIARAAKGSEERLRDCLLLYPGSTVEDLYNVMKRAGLLAGDYVRGETRDLAGKHRTLRKEDALVDGMIAKVSVNRKISWQHAGRATK